MWVIELSGEAAVAGDRNTVGGWPVLGPGVEWPDCTCGVRMALFFQIDVPEDIPHFGGEHLLFFQCPVHNDPSDGPRQLPERFWETPLGCNDTAFWRILRHRGDLVAAEPDPLMEPRRLVLRAAGPDDEWDFRIGGAPAWVQGPEPHTCACGTEMEFLLQVPENYGFRTRPGTPEQDGAFSSTDYGLLLGNIVYVLACPKRCDPAAAWPPVQN
jgi:hypothetical protein